MGLFGNLFNKKNCSVCGAEIGLLGNRKLEDGNLCKTCAKKLSPWFSERRHSTVEEIRQQLAYREENQKKAAKFSAGRSMGDEWRVLTDDTHRWITVARSRNLAEENPDILDYSSITGCRMDVDESRTELTREGKDGKKISYNPPRYEYSYDFDVIIAVNNPYFDEMRFRLNSGTIRVTQGVSTGISGGVGRFLDTLASSGYDPMNDHEYRQYYEMAQQICEEVHRIQEIARGADSAQTAAPAPAAQPEQAAVPPAAAQAAPANGPWTCPACGGANSGKFCEYCGTPRP